MKIMESCVKNMIDKNIINGYEDNTFRPNEAIKRSETVKIIITAFSLESKENTVEFSDLDKAEWFYPSVMTAASNGIINGFDGKFYPQNNITRQEFAVIITNLLNLYADAEIPAEEKAEFSDDAEIADWAKAAVYKIYSMGIMQGYENRYSPNAPLTRAEATVTIERIYNILGIK